MQPPGALSLAVKCHEEVVRILLAGGAGLLGPRRASERPSRCSGVHGSGLSLEVAKRGTMRRCPQAGGRHLKPAAARARPPSRESGRWWWAGSTATTCGTPSPPARDGRQRRPMGLNMLGGVPGGGCGWIALRGGRGGRRGQRRALPLSASFSATPDFSMCGSCERNGEPSQPWGGLRRASKGCGELRRPTAGFQGAQAALWGA